MQRGLEPEGGGAVVVVVVAVRAREETVSVSGALFNQEGPPFSPFFKNGIK